MAQLVRIHPLADKTGYFGQLYVNNTSLIDAMLQSGYCCTKPSMKKTGPGKQGLSEPHMQMSPGRLDMFPDPGMMASGPQLMGSSMFPGQGERSGPLKGPQREQRSTVSPSGNTSGMGGPGMGQPNMMNQQRPYPIKIR